MTMPHLMNCPHQSDGWCLDCVKRQHAIIEAQDEYIAWYENDHDISWYDDDNLPAVVVECIKKIEATKEELNKNT
jgi:hypothetical protein